MIIATEDLEAIIAVFTFLSGEFVQTVTLVQGGTPVNEAIAIVQGG